METKNKRESLERIRSLGFQQGRYVDPIGKLGGLALWWSNEVGMDVRSKSVNMFRCVVKWPHEASSFLVTFVYAHPVWNQKVEFWKVLKSVGKENGNPWLYVGDLNDCGSQAEKEGGNLCSQGQID